MSTNGGVHGALDHCLAGGGGMGALLRSFDWSRTPVGPVEAWPRSLKTAVSICLGSRYPIVIWWGKDTLTQFYNDAYVPILGPAKHPRFLGRSGRECWAEIWPTMGPMWEEVFTTGEATWSEDFLYVIDRTVPREEAYFTFSYSPIRDDSGAVGGIFCACNETTSRVVGERRLRTLRDLGANVAGARSAEEACEVAARALSANPADIPFALTYLLDREARSARLVTATGLTAGGEAAPERIEMGSSGRAPWPLDRVFETGSAELVSDLPERFGPLPDSPWEEPTRAAYLLPIAAPGQARPTGFLAVGLSPRRVLDDDYRGFLGLVAGHVGNSVANARAYEEERNRAEALAELDRAKTAFFSNVSHEFRTPLTLLLGPVEELLGEPEIEDRPARRARLEVVQRNALRLQKLVNTLLDFSRIEAGRADASFEPTDLATITAELASVFRSAVERAGMRLVVDCRPLSGPAFVDREMWEKIVLNLVSNAFKFTLEGEIEVSLRQEGGAAALRVRDTGSGIPEGQLPHIFERFHRVEGARARTHEGTGIGLALVHELVKLHGGTIAVESVEGEGTTFTIRIPLDRDHPPGDRAASARALATTALGPAHYVEGALRWLPGEPCDRGPAGEEEALDHGGDPAPTAGARPGSADRPRILLADDNADMRDYLRRLLAGRYRVETVTNGEEALRSIREHRPDLVLTDVMMPRLDGIGLLRMLRNDPDTRTIPVIMISARAGEEARIDGLAAGVDDYVTKPFGARDVLARVSSQLELARVRREAASALRESEERYRALVRASSDVVYRMSPDWTVMRHLEGRDYIADTRNPSGDWLSTYIHPDDQPHITAVIREAIRTGSVFELEHRVRRVDGTFGWTFSRAVPILDERGELVEWFGMASDVTERKRAEHERDELLARLDGLHRHAPIAIALFDTDLRFVALNERAAVADGLPLQDHLGKTVSGLLPELGPDIEACLRQVYETGEPLIGLDVALETPNAAGKRRHWLANYFPVRDEHGSTFGIGAVALDITEWKQAEEALRESERQAEQSRKLLTQLVGQCPFGMYIVDSDFRIATMNRGSQDGAFANVRPVIGRQFDEAMRVLWPEPVAAGIVREFRHTLETGESYFSKDFVNPRADRDHVEGYEWELHRVTLADGRPAVACYFYDSTRLRAAEAALRDADRRKDEFLAMLAHELRNPLAAISNAAQVAGRSDDPENREWSQGVIAKQVRNLSRMIDDLLDVSRITRGKIQLKKQALDLAPLIHSAVETGRPLMERRGHLLRLDLPDEPLTVFGDPTRLEQVMVNLLNNAAKYTDPGGRVTLSSHRDGTHAVLRVEDTGCGMSPDLVGRVFDLFAQGDRSIARSEGGLGIGLTLVKRIVEMHGGTVVAESGGPGKGSRFTVRLPLEHRAAHGAARRKATPAEETRARSRVLVVDDNADTARGMARLVRLLGHEVRMTHDGPSAIEEARSHRPDVIFLDIGLPGMDGYRVARALREEGFVETVIVAVSGFGEEAAQIRSRESGFDHHLVKPVGFESLVALVGRTH